MLRMMLSCLELDFDRYAQARAGFLWATVVPIGSDLVNLIKHRMVG